MTAKKFSDAELDKVKDQRSISEVFEQFGAQLRKAGRESVCLCPFHAEKTGSCTVDESKGVFHCFGCGAEGDVIDAVMRFRGCTFVEAVKELGGGSLEITDADRSRLEEKRRKQAEEDRRDKARGRASSERHFGAGQPLAGTYGAAYFKARGLAVTPNWTMDLRFAPALLYHGYANAEADTTEELGRFPCVLAAIRNAAGEIIGLHRTYLDPDRPAKLSPPGDAKRNKAKKVLGEAGGGMIRLSKMGPHLAMGEGMETSRSWYVLGLGGSDVAVASAISLGNLSGGCTGTYPHPRFPGNNRRSIPNGIPDVERPGVILPDIVEEVTLIGDADSDSAMTHARLLAAARRFRAQGRTVTISMAGDGMDFNDHLLDNSDEVAA